MADFYSAVDTFSGGAGMVIALNRQIAEAEKNLVALQKQLGQKQGLVDPNVA